MLKNRNIHIALTLTNHYITKDLYLKNIPFLEKYHQKGNIIICTSDELTKMIRKDFPMYRLRASIIKNINTVDSIRQAFDLYDDVVIPMDMNDDDEFLENLPYKDRIVLFANATCAYTCPARVCYLNISKRNQATAKRGKFMKEILGILENASLFFNVEKFHEMGFSNFKLIPVSLLNFTF